MTTDPHVESRMSTRLPRYARALLRVFGTATSPLRAEEALRILCQRTPLRSEIARLLVIGHLKRAGLLRYAEVTRASAEAALANAKRILDSLDSDEAPEIPSVGRYEMTEAGRAYLRRRVR
jgi:hypothetical protein